MRAGAGAALAFRGINRLYWFPRPGASRAPGRTRRARPRPVLPMPPTTPLLSPPRAALTGRNERASV